MARLLLASIFCLLSLLNLFRAPLNILWYISILTTEFCWFFFGLVILLLITNPPSGKFFWAINGCGAVALLLFSIPVVQALQISKGLNKQIAVALKTKESVSPPAFSIQRVFSGMNKPQLTPEVVVYAPEDSLSMDFYRARNEGPGPCIIVVHGGSWAGGDRKQLPELNTLLAEKGYNVFSIDYRLVPESRYPAPVEDVARVIRFLKTNERQFNLDASRIVLLGRSAGGQIALDAAYTLHDQSVKGVISYYGPTDMVWGYAIRANPLVLDSRKVMEDYLGGTYAQIPENYVKSSATETASIDSPPTLLIQGRNDPLVAYDHCNRLDAKLNHLGVQHFVLRLPWATHGCDYTLNGPSGQLSSFAVTKFLMSVL